GARPPRGRASGPLVLTLQPDPQASRRVHGRRGTRVPPARPPRGRARGGGPLAGRSESRVAGRTVGKMLLFWADGGARRARAVHAGGGTVVLWKDEGAHQLEAAGVPFRRAGDLLGEQERGEIDETAMAWTKAWGRKPLIDGKSFRELIDWKGTSL